MSNLTVISIIPFKRDFYWKLWYGCTGGFIGLNDLKNEYNVWSTPVEYELNKLIELAEKVNQKISSNMDIFKDHIDQIDAALEFYKEFEEQKDFDAFEAKVKLLEKWINET